MLPSSPLSPLYPPSVPAEQGIHLGAAFSLRLGRSVARIAVRGALTLTRAIVLACRPVALPARSDGTLMIQPGPRAVTHVACRSAYLRAHCDHLRVEDHSTRSETAGAQILSALPQAPFAEPANGHR